MLNFWAHLKKMYFCIMVQNLSEEEMSLLARAERYCANEEQSIHPPARHALTVPTTHDGGVISNPAAACSPSMSPTKCLNSLYNLATGNPITL